MDIINLNIISQNWDFTKKKIYSETYKNDSRIISPEGSKKNKKTKKEEYEFLQLFTDSDSLAEISPSLSNKLKREEEKRYSRFHKIIIFGDKNNKLNKKAEKRNNSSINFIIKKNFKEGKQENLVENMESSSKNITNIRKYITRNKSCNIKEENQNEEEEEISSRNISNITINFNNSKNFNSWNSNNNLNFSQSSRESRTTQSQQSYKRMYISKSQKLKSFSKKRKSKVIDSIQNLSKTIDIYLFNKNDSIKINVYPANTTKDIKSRIISELQSKNYKLSTNETDAYELRILDDPSDSPDLEVPPLRDYVKVLGLEPKALIFLKIQNFNNYNSVINEKDINISNREKSFDFGSRKNKRQTFVLESFKIRSSIDSVKSEDEDKNLYELKIYYKDTNNENNMLFENIFLNPDDTLKNVIQYYFKKDLLKIKNQELYYFIIHNEEEDFENAYNLNINIKNLSPPYELDLCYKIFYDIPKGTNTYNLSVKQSKIKKRIEELMGDH